MKTYMCLICGFVYDEAAGLPDEGLPPVRFGKIYRSRGAARTAAPEKKISRWSRSDVVRTTARG